jgi:hypothetical protein
MVKNVSQMNLKYSHLKNGQKILKIGMETYFSLTSIW